MKTEPFWTDDFRRPRDLAVAGLPASADVAVIGAGITGLMAARRLAAGGATVAVVDKGIVGSGASALSGGMTLYGPRPAMPALVDRFGWDLALAIWQANLDCVDLVEEVIATEAIDCGFARNGAAELGTTARDLQSFREESVWMRERLGFETTVLGPERVNEAVGSGHFHAALVDGFSGGLHPAKYTFGLAAAAARAGAVLIEHAHVLEVKRIGTGFVLRTALGNLTAGEVLIATNGYTGGLVPALRRRVVPTGSYLAVTEPLPPDLQHEIIPGGRMLRTRGRIPNYFRLTPDGRLLMGGRHDLRTDQDLRAGAEEMRRAVGAFFPQLAGVGLTHSWGGRVGTTFDLNPHIGRIDGLWYALGYSGHGMAVATYLGDQVGGMIGGEVASNVFAAIPHPTRWFYRKQPWFLPAVTTWRGLLDRYGR